jgi:putative DNA primase/helicase
MLVRHLYGKFFRFKPAFKIFLATNPLPVITGNEAAIWRRIKLVPFEVSFVGRENPKLLDSLYEELPGIMAWAIRGCQEWQQNGLGYTEAVVSATASYRDESDVVRQFVSEGLERVGGQSVRAGVLYAAYKAWASARGEKPMSGAMFGRRISKIEGIAKKEDSRGARYDGITVREDQAQEP